MEPPSDAAVPTYSGEASDAVPTPKLAAGKAVDTPNDTSAPEETVASPAVASPSQRAKNESLLTAGMGYGRRKAQLMEAFWEILLPGLLDVGWEAVSVKSCLGCLV